MPKLYYSPTSCGAASFIAAFANYVNLDVEQVNLSTHKTSSGKDFFKINAKGNVPALVFDNGLVLNEGTAILQWIADCSPGKIAPKNNTEGRYILQNVLSYIASEVHPAIGGLFIAGENDVVKSFMLNRAALKLQHLEDHVIGSNQFVAYGKKSIADYYLYVCLSWTQNVGIDLEPYPIVKAYFQRIGELAEVREAKKRMSLDPERVLAIEFYQVPNCTIA